MRVLKIHDWIKYRKPAFLILEADGTEIIRVERTKDKRIIGKKSFYWYTGDDMWCKIVRFKNNLQHINIHTYYHSKYQESKIAHIDELSIGTPNENS